MPVTSARPVALVSGMVAGVPGQGGATWAVLQYVLGLRSLGWDVFLVESVPGERPGASVRRYFDEVCSRFGLEDRATLLPVSGEEGYGLTRRRIREAARNADVLLDLAGTLRAPDILEAVPVRVYVDLDPGFTQLWQASEGIDMRLAGHTHHATVGRDIGEPSCTVPDLGIRWIPTLPPVSLGAWPAQRDDPRFAWTTLANWRAYGSIEHDGRHYGQKAHAFRALIDLPVKTGDRFEVALAIHPDERRDLAALRAHGWRLIAPGEVSATPDTYGRFIRDSLGEIGVAKTGYVEADCGWFSDRSVCYLASGRPVVAQETGFGRRLPTGLGLLPFSTVDEAGAAIEAVRRDYAAHARAAREIAETHFDARLVLARLLDAVGVA